ncbi:NAD(P)-dependent oxidoreductase [Prevotella sp. E9-3]|uniref:NAD(P)-dependent oxidoreductase n=1 Tax=Prevotella sp. E9-3 TaxID=2913621 RepID=UPI001EDBF7E9|nr:NAD(P)-dependent oxidoreductase [Prevotella sp. E9-3]UKK49485.1 NAD(P)-dependent oxidoreductase [Prevotella sp. E9-3]
MRIALIKETKTPVDNRVALTPKQVAELNKQYPQHRIVVQSSDIRAFTDEDYRAEGVQVQDDISDADILFGIKEAKIESLIPDKHYFFFAHIAKMQDYNRPLLQSMLAKNLTFSDYEYLVDENSERVCAFGWWAGVVGVYYTLRGYLLREGCVLLPNPDRKFTLAQMRTILATAQLPKVKILITGNGRVAQGATYGMRECRAQELTYAQFMSDEPVNMLSFYQASVDELVKRKDGKPFNRSDFRNNPEEYESDFIKYAKHTDIFISCHFWDPKAPVYLEQEDFIKNQLPIKMIGDVTCDICGSIKSTIRPATHAEPYYDFNPITHKEELPFSSKDNITVMAVDTCPNALAIDASEYFGEMLTEYVFKPLLKGEHSDVIDRSTILEKGQLTHRFEYLQDFAEGR